MTLTEHLGISAANASKADWACTEAMKEANKANTVHNLMMAYDGGVETKEAGSEREGMERTGASSLVR